MAPSFFTLLKTTLQQALAENASLLTINTAVVAL